MGAVRLSCQRKIYVLMCVICLFAAAGNAFGAPLEQITINYVEAGTASGKLANRVNAYFTVSGSDQNPISGLGKNNFELFEDGRKIEIDDAVQTTDPMVLVLVMDTSGSMQARGKNGQTSMEAARNAATNFISMLSRNDKVAIFSFNHEYTLQLDFSKNHAAAIKAINSLSARHNAATCLYDTAYEAVKKAAEIPRGRRAVILLTDGKDERSGGACSSRNSNDVIDVATTKAIRVPIYTIGVGPKVDARELRRISSLTGGRSMLASSLTELEGFYEIIAKQLKKQYLVKYLSKAPSGEHSLVIKVKYEGTQKQDEKRFWSPPLPVIRPPSVSFGDKGIKEEKSGIVIVKVEISHEAALSKVRCYIGGSLLKTLTAPPFNTFRWDTSKASGGLHVIRVEAVDTNGQAGSAEITTEVKKPDLTPTPTPTPKKTPLPAEEPDPGMSMILKIGIIILFLIPAAVILWWLLARNKRQKEDAARQEMISRAPAPAEKAEAIDSKEDETMYMPDSGLFVQTAPSAILTILKSADLDAGKKYKIEGTTSMGRAPENGIHIPSKSVSRKHAEIFFDGNSFSLIDRGSKYGTRVDGQNVPSNGTDLHDGSQIELGPNTLLEFNLETQEEEIGENEVTWRRS